jgi:hypothetical protein
MDRDSRVLGYVALAREVALHVVLRKIEQRNRVVRELLVAGDVPGVVISVGAAEVEIRGRPAFDEAVRGRAKGLIG